MEDQAALLAALRLQLDFGADEALEALPTGLRPAAPAAPMPNLAAPPASRPIPPGTAEAAELAAGSATLEALATAMRGFAGSALRDTATRFVFADGVPGAPVMLVGGAPGPDEDRSGTPFIGPAGALLDQMLGSIGVSRATNAYLTNILPWRPPGDRNPTEQELAMFLPFLRRHIALARPRLLILLGDQATKALLGGRDGISRRRGKWSQVDISDDQVIPALPTWHPTYLRSTPLAKREAWQDWLMLHRRMNEG